MIQTDSYSDNHSGEEDVLEVCPLCNSTVRFFFINFSEKILMCESILCQFPFGYEEVKLITVDTGLNTDMGAPSLPRQTDKKLASPSAKSISPRAKSTSPSAKSTSPSAKSTSPSAKSISPSAKSSMSWSFMDKLNKYHDTQKSKILNFDIAKKEENRKIKLDDRFINNKEMKKNVQDLKCLAKQLQEFDLDTDEGDVIKNEKWIKKLMNLQGLSGVKLVKKQEMELLKRKAPVFGGELKIDIGTNKDNMSSINIQILN